jgi:uncharacterized protein with GYD domain
MPKYLVEGRYTCDGLKGLAREGSSRRRADIARTIESAGGKLESLYFAFGDADFYIIYDAPDNTSAAALSVVANQSGFVTSKAIVLLTTEDMDQGIKRTACCMELPTSRPRLNWRGGAFHAANRLQQSENGCLGGQVPAHMVLTTICGKQLPMEK